MMRRLASVLAVWLIAAAATAQTAPVTADDLFTLQDTLYDASRDVAALHTTDTGYAGQLQRELDQLRDEVVYLRVRLRKDGTVPRGEIDAVRARIESVRERAKGESGPTRWGSVADAGPTPAASSAPGDPSAEAQSPTPVRRPAGCGPLDVCVGQELDVRVQTMLDSGRVQVEDRFDATTIVSFFNEDSELIPAGSLLTGVVAGVERAGRMDRKGSLTLAFERITVRGRTYPIRATVIRAIESGGVKSEIGKISVGAGVGAIIGGILGGVGGAVAGTVVGAGGIMLATEGPDVKIPPGTILRIRFDAPVTIQ